MPGIFRPRDVSGNPVVAPISGLSGATLQAVLEELALAVLPKEADFTDNDLSVAGVFPFTHNLGTLHPTVEVSDGSGHVINPDDVIIASSNAIGVKMTTYRPLIGNYHLKVNK